MAVAAACFCAKLAGQPAPAGERTARVLAGYRRTASDRNRGQARPFGISDLAAVLATFHRPRRRGCGIESEQVGLPETRNRSDPHLGRRHLPVDRLPGQRANDRMGRERLRTRAAQADPGTRSIHVVKGRPGRGKSSSAAGGESVQSGTGADLYVRWSNVAANPNVTSGERAYRQGSDRPCAGLRWPRTANPASGQSLHLPSALYDAHPLWRTQKIWTVSTSRSGASM